MWLPLLFFSTLLLSIFSCEKKKRLKGSKKDSVSSVSGKSEVQKGAADKRQGSDVEQKQSSYSGCTAPSIPTPAMNTEQAQKTPTTVKASEEQVKQKGYQVEATQDSEKSKKEVTSAKEKKTTKEKATASVEKPAVENAPGSSADDSDTFKHVMSIRDVVKKDKAMKQKPK